MTTTATISMQKAAKFRHFLSSQADTNLTFAAFVRNTTNPSPIGFTRHECTKGLSCDTGAQWLALQSRRPHPGYSWTRHVNVAWEPTHDTVECGAYRGTAQRLVPLCCQRCCSPNTQSCGWSAHSKRSIANRREKGA